MTDGRNDKNNNAIIYGKLVRDRIPEIIESHGKKPFIRRVEGKERITAISEKILEEAIELYSELNSGNRDEILKESADVFEIVLAALQTQGFTLDDLLHRAQSRRRQRGGFEKGLFLDQVNGGELCEIEFQKFPMFVFNPYAKGKLIHTIRTELAQSRSAWIASAFYSPGAANLLISEFSKFLETGGSMKIMLSTMGNITRPEYLEHLAAQMPEESLKIFHPPDITFDKEPPHFHVKTWLFQHFDGQGAMLIGSSNFTMGGMVNNIEWNYFSPREVNVSYDNQTPPFQAAVAEFERMWKDMAVPVSREFINGYKQRFNKNQNWGLKPKNNTEIFDPEHAYGRSDFTVSPNDAQKEALENLAAQRNLGVSRAAVVAATGIGKTYLAAFDFKQSQCKTLLFVAHREDILAGALETFRKVMNDPDFGVIYGRGNTDIGDGKAVFAMIQTLSRNSRLDNFPRNNLNILLLMNFTTQKQTATRGYCHISGLDFFWA
jgi:predicted house-cleaning noncanonical NTP pyrophosphatase (MazG superfamily)/HKD family nuclease